VPAAAGELKTVEKRLGAMEDSLDILRVAGARVGLYEAMEALFDERRLAGWNSGRHAASLRRVWG
jgi:hypothetical protein